MIRHVKIVKSAYDRMVEHSRSCDPEEACGVLAGMIDDLGTCSIIKCTPVTNTDHDPMHFSMDVKEQLAAVKAARKDGLKVVAIWHSHPRGPDRMTREDIKLAMDPDMVWIVMSHIDRDAPDIKSFTVSDEHALPVPLLITPQES